ncbi:MAG: hypothetical protein ACM31C_27230 [Acidobacteriota bacterium]
MRIVITLTLLAMLLASTSCSSVTCAPGTIEQGGKCQPATVTTGTAACGSDTMLVGNQCISTVVCDPDTTMPVVDPSTGMTVCKGTAGGGCGNCPAAASSSNQQTICGQIYDFETGQPFQASGGTGTRCPATPTTSGPCALKILPYDATAFATNPQTATPLAVADTCIDDMGRYYLKDITVPSGPFLGLGLDDADMANMGPTGLTNTVGVALPKAPGAATKNFEHFIVKPSTTASWASSGGPMLSTGYYVPVYRTHCVDSTTAGPGCTGDPLANMAGVQFTRNAATEPSNTFYFQAAETTRTTVDTAATSTGANGTALVNNATLMDSLIYSGTGGITDTANCKWETKAGATLPGIVFIQVYRKVNQIGKTCTE